MMRSLLLFAMLVFVCVSSTKAQIALSANDKVMQISGLVTTYYNYRFYETNAADKKKNRFALKDAQIDVRGWWHNKLEFKIKADLADLAAGAAMGDQSGLMEATVTYLPFLRGPELKFGFDKPAFSRFTMVQMWDSPFFNRPEMNEGSFFPHRDIGVTIQQGFYADRVILYGGVYNGAGDAALAGDNETAGTPEWIGRVDINLPSKLRYNFMPLRNDPKPLLSISANARHTRKKTFGGDDYRLMTVDGSKLLYGVDGAAQWKHVQLAAEVLQARIVPNDTLLVRGSGGNYYRAGGYAVQASWYEPRTGLILAARYDWFNPNDLVRNDVVRSLNVAVNRRLSSTQTFLKVQFMHRLPLQDTDVRWKEDDLRVGIQSMF